MSVKKHIFFFGALLLTRAALTASGESKNTLTLVQAMDVAIKNHVTVKLAAAKTRVAKGQTLKNASDLLPHLMGSISQSRVFRENLESQGFMAGGMLDPLLGPFNSFDARVKLTQSLFDLNAAYKYRSNRSVEKAALLQENLAQEEVASAAALAYLEAVRSHREVQSAQADYELAKSLADLAMDQHKAGLSTGVDVARSKTRLAQQKVQMIKAQDAARESLIRLERVVGLPLSEETVLTDDFQSFAIPIPTLEESIANALKDRLELQVAETLVNASMDDLKSEKAGYAPKLQVEGAYGLSGNVPKDSKEVGDIGAQLEVPLFNGGETRGKVKTARGHYEEAAARAVDTRRQIEEDVRLSLISLASSLDELETAQQTVQLAETELKMAKDRYSAGVGDNIQVLSAQTALAQAHATLVDALALTNVARVNLSMALGHVRSFKL